MKQTFKIALIALLTYCSNIDLRAQTPITVCPQSASFTSMTRGYYFTAPTTFTICGVFVEDDMSTAFQSAAIVRFTAGPPPAYSATTNNFVTLWQNLNYVPNNMIPVPNVVINAGDIIGIYGSRTANSVNSYGPAQCVINIQGFPTTTFRSGMQFDLAAGPGMHDIWNENNGSIGRVTMYTNCCPAPTPIATITGPTSVCEGDTVVYTVPPQVGATAYNWTVPAGAAITGGQNTTSLNVTWNTAPGGNLCIDWTDSCSTSTQTCLAVTVNSSPTLTLLSNASYCDGDLVPASSYSSTPAGGTFTWANSNPSIGLGSSGTGNTPAFTATNITGAPITSIISVIATANGCAGPISTYLITVNPIVSGTTNVSICQGDSLLIGGVFQSSAGTYTETLTSSYGCDSILTTNLTLNMLSTSNSTLPICAGDSVLIEGNYYSTSTSFPFTYTNALGCDSVVTYNVVVSSTPSFNITGGAIINLGQSVNLAVLPGVAGTSYFWDPPVGLSCLFCQNPIATPPSSMWYYVTVTNAAGCSIIDSVYIEVDPSSNIYVPNIFSPNKDGSNDLYLVKGKGIKQFNLAIYNRWGQKVFEADDIEKGWDGTKDGTLLNQGVFVYKLNVTMYDGSIINQTGNITLVR